MRSLKSRKYLAMLWRSGLALGLVAAPACSRVEAGDNGSPASGAEPAAQKLAAPTTMTAPAAVTMTTPTQPGQADLDAFKQALARKFDPSRISVRPASPEGGVLNIPNGRVAHAAVLVKDADGTLRRECISSSAEASALVEKIRKGAAQ